LLARCYYHERVADIELEEGELDYMESGRQSYTLDEWRVSMRESEWVKDTLKCHSDDIQQSVVVYK
jgi:hypothetical protein